MEDARLGRQGALSGSGGRTGSPSTPSVVFYFSSFLRLALWAIFSRGGGGFPPGLFPPRVQPCCDLSICRRGATRIWGWGGWGVKLEYIFFLNIRIFFLLIFRNGLATGESGFFLFFFLKSIELGYCKCNSDPPPPNSFSLSRSNFAFLLNLIYWCVSGQVFLSCYQGNRDCPDNLVRI